jgi:GT2 family glycosyltransferase
MAVKNLTAVVINFNTAEHTKASVRSLRAAPEVGHIVVVDNGSQPRDRDDLAAFVAQIPDVKLLALPTNLGFAEGSNAGIRAALEARDCDALLFLNSDAQLVPGGAKAMLELCAEDESIGSVGGRVTKPSGAVDSLGIAFYASCLASNRMTTRDRFLGPTGGCAIYRRGVQEELQTEHGHMFDPDFFCYAEDTDVAARALLLGYRSGYYDGVVAQHEGQASSGGGFNDFVLYHGIRNSVWMLVKCVPWPVLWLCSPLIVLMHAAIFVRHGLGGKGKVVLRLYRDAMRGIPAMLRKRRVIQAKRRIGRFAFMRCMTWRFYDADYLSSAIRSLFAGKSGRNTDTTS